MIPPQLLLDEERDQAERRPRIEQERVPERGRRGLLQKNRPPRGQGGDCLARDGADDGGPLARRFAPARRGLNREQNRITDRDPDDGPRTRERDHGVESHRIDRVAVGGAEQRGRRFPDGALAVERTRKRGAGAVHRAHQFPHADKHEQKEQGRGQRNHQSVGEVGLDRQDDPRARNQEGGGGQQHQALPRDLERARGTVFGQGAHRGMEGGRAPEDVPEQVGEVDRVTAAGVSPVQNKQGKDGVGGHARECGTDDQPVGRLPDAAGEEEPGEHCQHRHVDRGIRDRDELLQQRQRLGRSIRLHQEKPGQDPGRRGDDQRVDKTADIATSHPASNEQGERSNDARRAEQEGGIGRIRKRRSVGVVGVVGIEDQVADDEERQTACQAVRPMATRGGIGACRPRPRSWQRPQRDRRREPARRGAARSRWRSRRIRPPGRSTRAAGDRSRHRRPVSPARRLRPGW